MWSEFCFITEGFTGLKKSIQLMTEKMQGFISNMFVVHFDLKKSVWFKFKFLSRSVCTLIVLALCFQISMCR